jgi:hypothetical protein
MFFKEFNDIDSSIRHLKGVLIPEIRMEIASLNQHIQTKPEEDACQLQFFILVTNFDQEFEKLIRLLNMIFLPAFSARKGSTNIGRDDSNPKQLNKKTNQGNTNQFNEFKVLRAAHKRLYRILGNLRNICNDYVLEENWSDCKKHNCMTSHHLELKFLNYFNFTESTIIPLIQNQTVEKPDND